MCFTPTTRYEIIDIVSTLKNKKSAGHDEINNFILKGVISSIADPLEYIFNESLLTGQVPEQMKIAKVIPLFKKRRSYKQLSAYFFIIHIIQDSRKDHL